jgi:AraC family transcriptional regulator
MSRVSAAGIETGTVSARRQRLGAAEISEVVFAPGRCLHWHSHPHTCLAVVTSGGVRKKFTRVEEDAVDGTVVEMPAEEPHEDLFGRHGARIVVLESEGEAGTLRCFRDWTATVLAHRVSSELARPDTYTPLALEGLALELTAVVARSRDRGHREPRLEAVREMLTQHLASPPSLAAIASEVGIHPSHLARTFRARYGESVGEHGRRLRLEWAAQRLARTDEAIASIAAGAGFADQSHLTREFKRRYGVTPGRFRVAHR